MSSQACLSTLMKALLHRVALCVAIVWYCSRSVTGKLAPQPLDGHSDDFVGRHHLGMGGDGLTSLGAQKHASPGRQLSQSSDAQFASTPAPAAATAQPPSSSEAIAADLDQWPRSGRPVQSSAPTSESQSIEVPQANVTEVWTAEDLQRAAISGAVDVVIRAHLDLRGVIINPNPTVAPGPAGVVSATNHDRLALLYASPSLRSIRGNCTEPEAEAALGLPPGTFPDLLPLKPRQCLLIVEESWLIYNSGRLWVDNLYLKLRRRISQPAFAFIHVGGVVVRGDPIERMRTSRSTVYVTGSTFQGEHRGNAQALVGDFMGIAFYVVDCVFSDWVGFESPVAIKFQSVAHIRNTVFRNMQLHVELVDVSFEGIVIFQNVSLANVTLEHGAVVSTTRNDYQIPLAFDFVYYAEDDFNYDVDVEPVPVGERGMFGEEFHIVNDTMSDCVHLRRPPDSLLPGCPEESKAARNRTIARGRADAAMRATRARDRETSGAVLAPGMKREANSSVEAPDAPPLPPSTNTVADDYTTEDGYDVRESYDYLVPYLYEDYREFSGYTIDFAGSELNIYEVISAADLQLSIRTDELWLLATKEALPATPPAPGWPPYLPPPPDLPPRERTSLLPDPVTPSPAAAAAMLGPLRLTGQPQPISSGQHDGRWRLAFIALALIVPVLLCVWVKRHTQVMRCCWRLVAKTQHSASHQSEQSPRGQSQAQNLSHALGPGGEGTQSAAGVGSRAASAVSNGDDVPPASAMNSDFDYILPPHLALFSKASESLTYEQEPGSTVVAAPYTIESSDASPRAHEDAIAASADAPTPSACVGPEELGPSQVVNGGQHVECGISAGDQPQRTSASPTQAEIAVAATRDAAPLSSDSGAHQAPRTRTVGGTLPEAWGWHGSSGLVLPIDVTKEDKVLSECGQAVRRLQRQLDSFTAGDLFLGRFEMLGRHHRRRGGQAVVQFAAGKDRVEFAVKFFLDRAAFRTEAALYAAAFPSVRSTASPAMLTLSNDSTLVAGDRAALPMSDVMARFLPQVEAVCDSRERGLEDPRGRPLPPCIVMEKGESLQDLCDRADPDMFTVFAVLSNISRRLADMHAAGYVHRDLKPANVMWLPRQNRWTVIDFGCVARLGEQASLSFSLAYAPPEVVIAWQGQQVGIEARPALDAWSLGVTAFELLTGAPAFDLLAHGRSTVVSMLVGDMPLPWEGQLSRAVRAKLGVLSRPVLQLLQREPAHRSSLEAFHTSCTKMYATSTSTAHSLG